MDIETIGAAGTVTGSKHIVRTSRATVLLDCGLFQGRRNEANARNLSLGFDPKTLDAVVLSHAHIDHSGALPILTKEGGTASIFTTPATRDLCAAMLMDAAQIQAADARYINKRIARDHAPMAEVTPLYDEQDVVGTLARMISVPYARRQTIAPGIDLTLLDAGHVLGSAISVLDVDDDGVLKRIAFTGDLGRPGMPILRDPEAPDGVRVLMMESTYGDRLHPPIAQMDDALRELVDRVYRRGGKVVIPTFALERAQEIVYALSGLERRGQLPPIDVYVDSPLTVKITDVFKLHPECFDEEMRARISEKNGAFDLSRLHYVSDVEASKALDADPAPAIILSASGMCEGGRVVHHLRAMIEDPKNCVAIVGYQAAHTLGRRIAERRARVKIFGVERELRAEVVVLDGFSAHADQRDLVAYAERVRSKGPLETIVLVHGEPAAQRSLTARMHAQGFDDVRAPGTGDHQQL